MVITQHQALKQVQCVPCIAKSNPCAAVVSREKGAKGGGAFLSADPVMIDECEKKGWGKTGSNKDPTAKRANALRKAKCLQTSRVCVCMCVCMQERVCVSVRA